MFIVRNEKQLGYSLYGPLINMKKPVMRKPLKFYIKINDKHLNAMFNEKDLIIYPENINDILYFNDWMEMTMDTKVKDYKKNLVSFITIAEEELNVTFLNCFPELYDIEGAFYKISYDSYDLKHTSQSDKMMLL